jgi:hypothetical protein
MTIGQTGKRAQHFGQHRQNQYQLDYSQADNLPLSPPRRRRTTNQEQSSQSSDSHSGAKPATQHSEVQRSTSPENNSALTQPIAVENRVQREEVAPESPSAGDDLIQEVADRVFKLMLADVKKDRERSGGRFR